MPKVRRRGREEVGRGRCRVHADWQLVGIRDGSRYHMSVGLADRQGRWPEA